MKIVLLSPHLDFWNNKHSKFGKNGYILKYLYSISSNISLILPHGDGVMRGCEFPDYEKAEKIYGNLEKVAMGVLCSREPHDMTIPLINLPLDDDIFEFGLDKVLRTEADNIDLPWEERKSVAYWRGVAWPFRQPAIKELYDFPFADVKPVLTPWASFRHMIDIKYFDKRYNGFNGRPVPLSEHMNYKYILIMDGRMIASALQWVFGSGSVPILITDPGNSYWFKDHLKDNVNCVMVNPQEEHFGDVLRDKITFLIENDDLAKEIAKSAKALADEIFSPEFQRKYIRDQLAVLESS